jgi:hypothetical protein
MYNENSDIIHGIIHQFNSKEKCCITKLNHYVVATCSCRALCYCCDSARAVRIIPNPLQPLPSTHTHTHTHTNQQQFLLNGCGKVISPPFGSSNVSKFLLNYTTSHTTFFITTALRAQTLVQ